ncbi:Hypothetical protein FKW44_006121, partial [Caligus rogercresseyi]
PETTDHLLWKCPALNETYKAVRRIIEGSFNTTISEEDFLSTSSNAKCDAVITKIQFIIYKLRTINDNDLSGILP